MWNSAKQIIAFSCMSYNWSHKELLYGVQFPGTPRFQLSSTIKPKFKFLNIKWS